MLTVRAAQPVDAMAVAEVHVRSWQAAYRGLLPDGYLDALRPEDRASRYTFDRLSPNVPATLVGEEGRSIRGFATTGAAEDDAGQNVGELLALYVDPSWWGQGIGRRLMAEARVWLTKRGFDEAILWVLAGNDRAERFYRADGWTLDGVRREEEVWGVMADEVRYRRALARTASPG